MNLPEARPVDAAASPAWVPIRELDEAARGDIEQHLLALNEQDRYLRFGYSARDEQIRAYVQALDFGRGQLLGIYNRKLELIAVAHLAVADEVQCSACAEFGVSVAAHARGRGYGSLLFARAAKHARNIGVRLLFIHALSENVAMLKIAQRAGATIEHHHGESDAFVRLGPATVDTRLSEVLEQQFAQVDYHLKVQALELYQRLRQYRAASNTH